MSARITLDPALETCPDYYSSSAFQFIRTALVSYTPTLSDADAAAQLVAVWNAELNTRKAAWATQLQADADAEADADAAAAAAAAAEAAADFLYYHPDPQLSPMAGSVRLRATLDNAPSSFHCGQDLLLPSEIPWQVILPQIATRPKYSRFRQQLLHDQLVSDHNWHSAARSSMARGSISPPLTIFHVSQSFPILFHSVLCLTIVGSVASHSVQLVFFSESRGTRSLPFFGGPPQAHVNK
ncbi:hypothetical protein DFH09DRAFT_1322782 [Mycena vulgaris]|nr:hypothetical protein DFH09DRAFT_1322782 [Mycena vulgaris]